MTLCFTALNMSLVLLDFDILAGAGAALSFHWEYSVLLLNQFHNPPPPPQFDFHCPAGKVD